MHLGRGEAAVYEVGRDGGVSDANICMHESVRSVTGLAGASPAPARPARDACVGRHAMTEAGAQ